MPNIYRDSLNANKGPGNLNSNTINSMGTFSEGINNKSPGIENCLLKDISMRLTKLILKEKFYKAEYDMIAFDRMEFSRCLDFNNDMNNNIFSNNYIKNLSGEDIYSNNNNNNNNNSSNITSQSNRYNATSTIPDKIEKSGSFGSSDTNNRNISNILTNNPNSHTRSTTIKSAIQTISLIILDTQSMSVNDKERDRPVGVGKASASLAAKEKIQIEKKVLQFANTMWNNCVVNVIQSQRIRGNHTATQSGLEGVVILASELPFYLIRDLGSIILRISSSSSSSSATTSSSSSFSSSNLTSHNISQPLSNINSNSNSNNNVNNITINNNKLFQIFYSSPLSLPFKKVLKAIVIELSHLSISSARNLHPGSVLVNSTPSLVSPLGNVNNQNRDVFLYSICDDKYDFISYSPTALTRVI